MRYGTQKLVSSPPENARTARLWVVIAPSEPVDQGIHHGLLHVEPVLGLVDDERARRVDHRVGHLDVAPHGEAVRKEPAARERHLALVDDEVLEALAHGPLLVPAAEVGEGTPALG